MTRVGSSGITTEGVDFSVDLTVEGDDEGDVNSAAMYLKDQAARVVQAFEDGKPPSECDGIGVSIDWESTFEDDEAVADGGVTEDDLREATTEFFDDADVDSVDYSPESDAGMVVVNVEEVDAGFGDGDTFDVNDFDEHLATFGFEYTGYVPAPGMTQVNVASNGGGE